MENEVFSEIVNSSRGAADCLDRYETISVHGSTVTGRLVRHGRVWFVKSYSGAVNVTEADLRLTKEYEILLKLNHPGIVRGAWLEQLPETGAALIMEMVEGETMDRYLQHATRKERRAISDLMLDAMAYVHSHGVCHLDLKPQNILVAGRGNDLKLKIIDFGMSDWAGNELFKTPGGTRGFSDPDQFNDGYAATPQSDVYALGQLLKLIDGGRTYRHVAAKATNRNKSSRPHDAGQLIELRRKFSHRHLICAVAAIAVAVTVVILISVLSKKSATTDYLDEASPSLIYSASTADDYPAHQGADHDSRSGHDADGETGLLDSDEYRHLFQDWKGELDARLDRMIEISSCDTIPEDIRSAMVEQMYEELLHDSEEHFEPYLNDSASE